MSAEVLNCRTNSGEAGVGETGSPAQTLLELTDKILQSNRDYLRFVLDQCPDCGNTQMDCYYQSVPGACEKPERVCVLRDGPCGGGEGAAESEGDVTRGGVVGSWRSVEGVAGALGLVGNTAQVHGSLRRPNSTSSALSTRVAMRTSMASELREALDAFKALPLVALMMPRCLCGADAESQCHKCGAHLCKRDRSEVSFQTFLCAECADALELIVGEAS